jgi:hypothetical protein
MGLVLEKNLALTGSTYGKSSTLIGSILEKNLALMSLTTF